MRNEKGQFIAGWKGEKTCIICNKKFIANSGFQKICHDCRNNKKCEWCGKTLEHPYKRFCNNSCAGKWKQANLPQVRTIDKNRLSPKRAEGIRKARLGKPRYEIRGEKNPNWKGGTYRKERHQLMGRVEYKNWRNTILKRDNYTCQICHRKETRLEVHHIIPYKENKKLALNINNGITVCKDCHKFLHSHFYKIREDQIPKISC